MTEAERLETAFAPLLPLLKEFAHSQGLRITFVPDEAPWGDPPHYDMGWTIDKDHSCSLHLSCGSGSSFVVYVRCWSSSRLVNARTWRVAEEDSSGLIRTLSEAHAWCAMKAGSDR